MRKVDVVLIGFLQCDVTSQSDLARQRTTDEDIIDPESIPARQSSMSAAIGFCSLAANRICPLTASCTRNVAGIERREEVQALTGSSLAGLHTAPGPGVGWASPRALCATPLSPALPAGRPHTELSMLR